MTSYILAAPSQAEMVARDDSTIVKKPDGERGDTVLLMKVDLRKSVISNIIPLDHEVLLNIRNIRNKIF